MLKVTDDVQARPARAQIALCTTRCLTRLRLVPLPPAQCLKYKTDQAADLKKVEKMNALCLSLMGRGLDASPGA